jgi:tRNA-2-methylthio-N6-dimethylallyladenosine synthase
MKFYVETFGCQMNVADSREMSRHLIARGFQPTADKDEADCVLVNTCTVRDHAEHKALSYLGRLVEERRRLLVVAGCAAERLGQGLRRRFPEISLVVGAKSIGEFDRLLDERWPEYSFDAAREHADAWGGPEADAPLPGETVTASVTIQRGCNYSCAYCIVPSVRGREIYRPAASVLADVRRQAARGLRDILLLGQTVNAWRGGDGEDFAELLRRVDDIPGVRRVRFMSPHPFHMNERLIAAIGECARVTPHVHLPVQSGSDAVLARMRRNTTRADVVRRIAALRAARPGLAVTTDFIVGFPGETEDDFVGTLSLVSDADLDGAYCFKYSPRPGTPSAAGPDDVPEAVKEERLARLLEVVDRRAEAKLAACVGTDAEVLVEAVRSTEEGILAEGRTPAQRKIFFSASPETAVGDYRSVRVSSRDGKTLWGRENVGSSHALAG